MQTLKDEVKSKIMEAAVEEFLVDGYANSSLREIAAHAGITIGNIYSYFSSKEDLFDQVVSPAWESLSTLMSMPMAERFKPEEIVEISERITCAFVENKKRFFILLNGSNGTKYDNIRGRIEDFISLRFQRESLRGSGGKFSDPLFAKALAAALFAGFVTVFSQYGGDDERLRKLVGELLSALLGNLLGGE